MIENPYEPPKSLSFRERTFKPCGEVVVGRRLLLVATAVNLVVWAVGSAFNFGGLALDLIGADMCRTALVVGEALVLGSFVYFLWRVLRFRRFDGLHALLAALLAQGMMYCQVMVTTRCG